MAKPSFPYTEELAEEICEKTANSSKGLFDLCDENPTWPRPTTIKKWRRTIPSFASMYALAKCEQADHLADEIIKIADDDSHDTVTKVNDDGSEYETCNSEWIARSRLRVDTRKWLAAKLLPKVYGDSKNDLSTEDKKSLVEQLIDKL